MGSRKRERAAGGSGRGDSVMRGSMIRLVLPIAFQQFMLALVGASDALMLGKLNQDSMSAVSLATQVTFVFNLFMMAFVIGENMFVAQYYGKRDYEGISDVFALVMRISCMAAVVFSAAAILIPAFLMRIFTNEPELIVMGSEYLRCVGISYLLSAVAQVCMTVMKNCGAVNMSTALSSVAVVLNIALNAVLIFGLAGAPAFGIRGAAYATVIATAVQTVWSSCYIRLRMPGIRIFRPRGKAEPEPDGTYSGKCRAGSGDLYRRFWGRTWPVLLNELAWGGGFTMYSVIMGHMGSDAVAANSIANIAKNLVVCICGGFGGAGSILVGNELGAGRFEEAKKTGRMLIRAALICGVGSGAFLLAVSPLIVRVAGLTATAESYLWGMLLMCSYYLVGKSINGMTIGGIFPAGGDSRFGLCCDAVTMWCVTVPLGCIAAFVLKLPVLAVYFVLNLDEIVKLPAVYRHYRKYGWVENITETGGTVS